MFKLVVSLLLLCFLSCTNGFIGRDPGRIFFKNFATTKSKVGSLGDRETNSQKKVPKRLNGKKAPKSDNCKACFNGKMDECEGELPDIEAMLKNLRELLPDGEIYGLRKVTEWLAANGTPRSDYKYSDNRFSPALYHSGLLLTLNKDLYLSIQTAPATAGNAFCETALVTKYSLLYDSSLGYGDVCRWDEPEDLFKHIVEIRQKLKDKQANQKPGDNTEVPL